MLQLTAKSFCGPPKPQLNLDVGKFGDGFVSFTYML